MPVRIDRRTALQWMLTVAAAAPLLKPRLLAGEALPPSGKGYGADPDLLRDYHPGELWPLTFTDAQRLTAAALCDLIIPADKGSPGAAQVGVVDFIDEWVSAPYPQQRQDRRVILDGLVELDREARTRFGSDFHLLSFGQSNAICADICYVPEARADLRPAAIFFARFRDLTAGGFYTTPEGAQDLGYIGNKPLATFDGPPPEVLRHVGLL